MLFTLLVCGDVEQQKVIVDATSLSELAQLLEAELRIPIDSLAVFDAEFDDFVLLKTIHDLPAKAKIFVKQRLTFQKLILDPHSVEFADTKALAEAYLQTDGPRAFFVQKIEKLINPHLEQQFLNRKEQLRDPANTVMKFYVCDKEDAKEIAASGFKLPSLPGVFGRGIHFANGCGNRLLPPSVKLLLCEVAIGCYKLVMESDRFLTEERLREQGYDSVYAPAYANKDVTSSRQNEFVVYHPQQALPCYCVTVGVEQMTGPRAADRCAHHPTEELKLFCTQCNMPICALCPVLGSHQGHSCDTIAVEATRIRSQVHLRLEASRLRLIRAQEYKKRLEQSNQQIRSDADEARRLVDEAVDSRIKAIQAQRIQLHAEINSKEERARQDLMREFSKSEGTIDACQRELSQTTALLTLPPQIAFLRAYSELGPEPCNAEGATPNTEPVLISRAMLQSLAAVLSPHSDLLLPVKCDAGTSTSLPPSPQRDTPLLRQTLSTLESLLRDDESVSENGPSPTPPPTRDPQSLERSVPTQPQRYTSSHSRDFLPSYLPVARHGNALQQGKIVDFEYSPYLPPFSGGILNYIGHDYGRAGHWTNPMTLGQVLVTVSSGRARNGALEDFVSNAVGVFYPFPIPGAWIQVDFMSNMVCPSAYALAYYKSGTFHKPRNWDLRASNDTKEWTVLSSHRQDKCFGKEGHKCTSQPVVFPLADVTPQFWRYFRIVSTGRDSSNNDFLKTSCIEFYGALKKSPNFQPSATTEL
eukprot:TRINITY_DN8046_c0_g1_i1.p1 TRINITY_DN8046_c0_g1~~TRINITY_DN8046_c0_g1_i1.p1  ORF type:complete len:764 (-),score=110.93 TRINITY_DN8046_c0_g1_i1:1323-3590(-)